MKKFTAALFLLFGLVASSDSLFGGLILSANPSTLNFNGAGPHLVELMIRHDGNGANTLSGYTIRFGSVANASLGVLPSGVTASAATTVEGLLVSSNGLFSLNPATNTVSASSLVGNTTISTTDTTLFRLGLTLGNAATYNIGVDFQNAQRGGLFATDISSEFFNPNSATTDFSFTLTNVTAVPEPSSMLLLAGAMTAGVICFRRDRKRKAKKSKAVIE